MKKLAALILALVMCVGLCIPAFAEFPEEVEDAIKKYSFTTDMDDYDSHVEANVVLYDCIYQNIFDYPDEPTIIDEDNYIERDDGYTVISSDSKITFANTGEGDDYYVYLVCTGYKKDEQGRWVSTLDLYGPGDAILQKDTRTGEGIFLNANADYPYVKLYEGQSFTFEASIMAGAGREIESDTMFFIEMFQYYPESNRYWRQTHLLYVDDAKAAEIRAAGKTTTEKTPAPEKTNPFTDVAKDAYYYDAVLWALENNITTGTTATTFSPNATCTRGQVVTFLWRAVGCPEPITTENPFTDVTEKDYFYKPILWAVEHGITTGTSDTTFSPGDTCTSAHVVTFLCRWRNGKFSTQGGDTWYSAAVDWANSQNLLDGMGKAFDPTAPSPRADIVTYIYRIKNK